MIRPTAIKVEPLSRHRLRISFDNGEVRIFDVEPYIKGSWFGELEEWDVFRNVSVNGHSVEWAGGQDIFPDDLYYNSYADDGEGDL